MDSTPLITRIADTADLLRKSALKPTDGARETLQKLCADLSLQSPEEVMAFVAVFDRQCAGHHTDLDQLAAWFGVASLNAMQLAGPLLRLVSAGMLDVDNPDIPSVTEQSFTVVSEVFQSLIQGHYTPPVAKPRQRTFDRFDLCEAIHRLTEQRKEGNVGTSKMLRKVEGLEEEHGDLAFVRQLKSIADSVADRVFFYEMCREFTLSGEGARTDMDSVLNDIYDSVSERIKVKALLFSSRHPLIVSGLIEQTDDKELAITAGGLKLLFGDEARAWLPTYENLGAVEFIQTVSNLIEGMPVNPSQLQSARLGRKVVEIESANPGLPFIASLRSLMDRPEDRILLYRMCQCAMDRSPFSVIRGLDALFPLTQRLLKQQELLAHTHPLVTSGLVEFTDANETALTPAALRLLIGEHAEAYLPSYSDLDRYGFIETVEGLVNDLPNTLQPILIIRLRRMVEEVEAANPSLGFIAKLKKTVQNVDDRLLFYLTCESFVEDDTMSLSCCLDRIYTRYESLKKQRTLKSRRHRLQSCGLVELTKDTLFGSAHLVLTEKGKQLFLEEDMDLFENSCGEKELIQPDTIKEKRLFFAPELQDRLDILGQSLREENYKALLKRLEARNLPKGVAALLYGAPGTGKTETVMQLARTTGRALMHVDISATKTCWFGESEKLIKEVFERYRRICLKSRLAPILFFNEADAVFAKRKDSSFSSVAQTENAIQAIILEEMERLDGILVATTNLAGNLDPAFERRFLFKIPFNPPSPEAERSIWLDRLPELTIEDADRLAGAYRFSGAEIDNIARKAAMAEIVNGTDITISEIEQLCAEEKIRSGAAVKVGFA